MATKKAMAKEELVEQLFSIMSKHRDTRRNNKDGFFKKIFDATDGSPMVLNAIASMSAIQLFNYCCSDFITKEQADAIIKNKGAAPKNISIGKDVEDKDIFGKASDQFCEFANSMVDSMKGGAEGEVPLTQSQMDKKMKQIDAIANIVSSSEQIKAEKKGKDLELVGSGGSESIEPAQVKVTESVADKTTVLTSSDSPYDQFVQPDNTAMTIGQQQPAIDVINAPAGSELGDTSALALALAYTALAKSIKSFPNISKLLQRERNLPELLNDPLYSANLVEFAKKMRKLTDEDECLRFISDRMFSGNNLKNFESLLTFSINITENRIERSPLNAIIQFVNGHFRESVQDQSRDLTRTLLAYDDVAQSMQKPIAGFTAHSFDIAEMLMSEHRIQGAQFENAYPDVFALMEDSGVFSQLDNGFVSKMLTKSKQGLGMDNKDILAKSRLTIAVRSFGLSLNKEGKGADDIRKSIVNSLDKISKAAANRSGLTEEQSQSISKLSIGIKGMAGYLGVKSTTPIRPRPQM